jgi:carotenoid cleavage dioxygenase-like enzyme
VRGALPPALSGRIVGIGTDGAVHSIDLHAGRATYTAGHPGPLAATRDLLTFNTSIYAFGEDLSVHELSSGAESLRRVDFAGCGRVLAACPRPDPITGELHLVARDADGAHEHVVVTASALTRRSRPIMDAPSRIDDLAVGVDHVVYVADGVVGVAPRRDEARPTWITADAAAPRPIHVDRTAGRVALFCLTPSLERWTLYPGHESRRRKPLHREVIDPAPAHYARTSGAGTDAPRSVWTTGDGAISRHDLGGSRTARVDLTPDVPGDFVLVPARRHIGAIDDGWFVGVVHDASGTTSLRVIATADVAGPSAATVVLPHAITAGLRCGWLPLAQ